MTLFVYKDGAMHADRAHVMRGDAHNVTKQLKPKIHIAKDKTFAYGVSGPGLVPEEHAVLESYLRKSIWTFTNIDAPKNIEGDLDLKPAVIEMISGRHMDGKIHVLYKSGFTIYKVKTNEDRKNLVREVFRPEDVAITGSGLNTARCLHLLGYDIPDIFLWTSRHVDTVSAVYDTVTQQSLKPIPKKRPV